MGRHASPTSYKKSSKVGSSAVLVGELGKFVHSSSRRFRGLDASDSGLSVDVLGGPGEAVQFVALLPDRRGGRKGSGWLVRVVEVVVPADGVMRVSVAQEAGP